MAARDTVEFLVGKETEVEHAAVRVDATARIDGRFDGEIEAGHLIIGKAGSLAGNATVGTAEIVGTFRGTIAVAGLLTVRSTGSVEGEIAYGSLAIDSGGQLVGALSATETGSAGTPVTAEAARDGAHSDEAAPGPEAAAPVADDEPDDDWTVEPAPAPEPETTGDPSPPQEKKAPARAARAAKPASSGRGTAAKAAAGQKAARTKAASSKAAAGTSGSRKTTDDI